jgi:hypothetical protein
MKPLSTTNSRYVLDRCLEIHQLDLSRFWKRFLPLGPIERLNHIQCPDFRYAHGSQKLIKMLNFGQALKFSDELSPPLGISFPNSLLH